VTIEMENSTVDRVRAFFAWAACSLSYCSVLAQPPGLAIAPRPIDLIDQVSGEVDQKIDRLLNGIEKRFYFMKADMDESAPHSEAWAYITT